ncbi:MAG: DUF4445 domain-containing protein [Lachnospiraceae bacterium]|nr:DUF4445 domain-containing protein [Lachnospiraceae bacterium]
MSQRQLVIRRENEDSESRLSFSMEESLLLLCQQAGISIETPCNGKGICGKCRVQFLKGAPLPQPAERRSLTPDELRQGIRLACAVKLTGDCEVLLPKEKKPDAVTGLFEVGWKDLGSDCAECFLVADIGTTTVVVEKRRKCDGAVIDVYKGVNAQRAYGADVLSRMEAVLSGNAQQLSRMIKGQLSEAVQQLTTSHEKVDFMVIAANTTMVHLLMEYDVTGLSRAPFKPETLDEITTEIAGIRTYVMPGISAFVGGDIVAGLHAVEFVKGGSIRNLFIDLGTNAELVLYENDRGICCATAAGPAFDGDAGTGFFGSDMIALLAKLMNEGIVDEMGTLDEAHFEKGVAVSQQNKTMHISQKQIRNLQLAKAAVRGGIEVLLKKANLCADQIERVYLAGGFGYYLDVHAAIKIGLLPKELENKTISCGNGALLGAAVYGYKIMTGENRSLPMSLQAINLAEEELFAENYVNYMNLTENTDRTP